MGAPKPMCVRATIRLGRARSALASAAPRLDVIVTIDVLDEPVIGLEARAHVLRERQLGLADRVM